MTRTRVSGSPNCAASMPRTRNGICVDVQTVTEPSADVPVGDHAAALERRRVAAPEVEALAEDVRGARRTRRRRRRPRTRCARSCCRRARRAGPARRARAPPPRRAPPAAARTRRRSARPRPRRCARERATTAATASPTKRTRSSGSMRRVPVLASGRVAIVVVNGGRSRRSSPLTTSATPSSARAREHVDRDDPRVGVRAAEEGDVQRARRLDVVEVDAAAREEAGILDPHHARADVAARSSRVLPRAPAPPGAPPRRCRRSPCSGRRCRRGARGSRPRSGSGILVEQRLGREQHARRAEPALQAVALAERLLDRVQARRSSASPSTVSTSAPSACTASMRHDSAGRPSTSTVQAPQTPCSQPTCVPVRPSSWRRKSESSVRGSASATQRRGR